MKKFKALATSALLGCISFSSIQASTLNGETTVRIISPLNMAPGNAGLRFGAIIPNSSTAGTIAISAVDGSETCINVLCYNSDRGAAEYNISGEDGKTVSISVSPTSTLSGIDVSSFGNSMTSTLHTSVASVVFDPNGEATFNVGGVLTIAPSQSIGAYAGSFIVSVNYQ